MRLAAPIIAKSTGTILPILPILGTASLGVVHHRGGAQDMPTYSMRRLIVATSLGMALGGAGCHSCSLTAPCEPTETVQADGASDVEPGKAQTSIKLALASSFEAPPVARVESEDAGSAEVVELIAIESEPVIKAQHAEAAPPGVSATVELGSPDTTPKTFPIDLATSLRLGGGNNLQIQLAHHRVVEAQARLDGAEALWLPTVTLGAGWNKHDGRIQDTRGDVLEVSRNAAYVGTAPTLVMGGGPISSVDLTDALFEPLAACQIVRASKAALTRTMNDTLLAIALVYIDLVEAQSRREIAHANIADATQLVDLTERFAEEGEGLESDAARARDELARRQRQLIEAEEDGLTASVQLAGLLRLDPTVTLHSTEPQIVPVEMILEATSLEELIAQALAVRPETEEYSALLQASLDRLQQERYRPYLPRIRADLSAGGFGGGTGSHFTNFSDRTDFTVMAAWEMRNFGLGNRALHEQRKAQVMQAQTEADQVKDIISAEVAAAFHQVQQRRRLIEVAERNVQESQRSLELNMQRIRSAAGLPIEVLQAIQSVADARHAYLNVIANYNRAQLLLLRSVGEPPTSETAAQTIPSTP